VNDEDRDRPKSQRYTVFVDEPSCCDPRSGGQLLADQLALHGVELAFCVPGESYLALLDGSTRTATRFAVITCRHEAAAPTPPMRTAS